MDPNIEFRFDEVDYTVSHEAYDLELIVLPDGRVLVVNGWRESEPPIPIELKEIDHGLSHLDPAEIAQRLDGVVAEVK